MFFLEEPGLYPKASLLFLNFSSFALPSSHSLISNYLNLHFGTQGRSIGWTKPLPIHQKYGCEKDLHQKGCHRVLFGFNSCLQLIGWFSSVQFSRSVVSDSLRPHESSMPGLPVHHQHPEFTQALVHRVGDAIQPSHPFLFPSPPAPNPSQHQGLFQWVNSSHEVAIVLEFQL